MGPGTNKLSKDFFAYNHWERYLILQARKLMERN